MAMILGFTFIMLSDVPPVTHALEISLHATAARIATGTAAETLTPAVAEHAASKKPLN